MSTAAILSMEPGAQPFAAKSPAPMADSGSSSSSSSASSGAGMVTASDFLTLLVTEMKNQDPTSNQDPNEYINQLVQVNSLQQLISINEVLTNSLGDTSNAPASSTPTKQAVQNAGTQSVTPATSFPGIAAANRMGATAKSNAGNLTIPAASPSAMGIAHALDGSKPALKAGGAIALR